MNKNARIMFSGGSRAWANNLNDLRERWAIRREEPEKFIVPVILFKEDVCKLQREKLLTLKVDLIKLLNDGKKALLKHKNIKREEGVYLQADEYSDLFFTIRAISTHIQEVNHALGKARALTFPQIFINVCEEKLSSDLFEELVQESKKLCRSNE